jgi:hypothetical protein
VVEDEPRKLTFGEQLRILKIQKIAREQEEERQRIV